MASKASLNWPALRRSKTSAGRNGSPETRKCPPGKGWLYLGVVLELYSRRVMGWAIAERMTASLVCDALVMALWRQRMPKGMIVHSDRGSQYCSAAYQRLFDKHQLICSMSKKGDCYDNAAMESWNHSFKVEAVHGERFLTRSDAKYQVFE
jgi:putative transposase